MSSSGYRFTMRRSIALVLLAALAVVSTACAAAAPGSDLTGKTWLLTAVTEQVPAFQGVVPAEEQGKYTVAFNTDGTFDAQADCNQVAGEYAVADGNKLTITPGASTLMLCPEGEFGVLFVNGLADAASYTISDQSLKITKADGGTLDFVSGTAAAAGDPVTPAPAAPADATPLVGPTWQLVGVTQQVPAFQGVVPEEDQAKYTIAFADDGTFSSTVDCNQLSGSYTAGADGSLSIIPGPMTMAMCPEGSLGDLYVVGLANASGWAVDGTDLQITLDDGGELQFAGG